MQTVHKSILMNFITLMEMESLQIWSDSAEVDATCSWGINKPVAGNHLSAICASEYLLNFSPKCIYLPEILHLANTVCVMRHLAQHTHTYT